MKNHLTVLLFIVFALHPSEFLAQGTFQNLGFESANVPDLGEGQSGGFVSISAAMPGWSAYIGTDQITQVLHNDYSIGSSIPSILGPISPALSIIEGNYTALLVAGSG